MALEISALDLGQIREETDKLQRVFERKDPSCISCPSFQYLGAFFGCVLLFVYVRLCEFFVYFVL